MRRDPAFWVLVAALLVLLLRVFSHGERITADGVDHYVFLRSLAVGHDLDLADDYAVVSPRGASSEPPTPIGRTGNAHPIGPALLWAPFYLAADLVTRARGLPPDGWNPLYRDAVAVGSLLYGWAGLLLAYLAARAFGRASALLAVLGLAFGTFLYWYLVYDLTMAHATSFMASALFVWLWLRDDLRGPRRGLLLGAALGLAALNRWSSVLLALLPAITALPRLREEGPRRVLEEALAAALAFLVVFSPQMVVWKRLYGSFLTIPQGSRFVSGIPAWDGVLFSPHHGLFAWSPLLYLGLAGLALWARQKPWPVLAAFVFLLALTRANAGVADWWGGSAFGARRFDAALPLFGLGLAASFSALAAVARRFPLVLPGLVSLAFVAWNLALAAQHRIPAWGQSDPVAFETMGQGAVSAVDRALGSPFSLPGALLEWARGGPPPSAYESLYMRRGHARWTLRMGDGDRLFLEDGWSGPRSEGGVEYRTIVRDSAGLVVPLHVPAPYLAGARVRATRPLRARLLVNGQVLGSCEVGEAWSDCVLDVKADHLRPGRNALRLRPLGPGELRVAGAWLEPAPGGSSPAGVP